MMALQKIKEVFLAEGKACQLSTLSENVSPKTDSLKSSVSMALLSLIS